uniref:Uncharacterized protein n=1 Tax=Pipistrellus kuhlii TaxID=59472 RepID=A0A7J7YN26_PIPKU|nr:hypothetical protein mPipKuh1_010064 [Pipistrellus kuhlii]
MLVPKRYEVLAVWVQWWLPEPALPLASVPSARRPGESEHWGPASSSGLHSQWRLFILSSLRGKPEGKALRPHFLRTLLPILFRAWKINFLLASLPPPPPPVVAYFRASSYLRMGRNSSVSQAF